MNDFHVKLAPAAILTGDRWNYAHASPFKLVKARSDGTVATAIFLLQQMGCIEFRVSVHTVQDSYPIKCDKYIVVTISPCKQAFTIHVVLLSVF